MVILYLALGIVAFWAAFLTGLFFGLSVLTALVVAWAAAAPVAAVAFVIVLAFRVDPPS